MYVFIIATCAIYIFKCLSALCTSLSLELECHIYIGCMNTVSAATRLSFVQCTLHFVIIKVFQCHLVCFW